jgi:hypothetical protein
VFKSPDAKPAKTLSSSLNKLRLQHSAILLISSVVNLFLALAMYFLGLSDNEFMLSV